MMNSFGVNHKIHMLGIILLIYIFIHIALPLPKIAGDGPGDYPPPTKRDWIISNDTYISNETILIEGNLNVTYNATLTLYNVTLLFNSSFDDSKGIYIEMGGTLNVYDSTISALNGYYNFEVNGNMEIERSIISRTTGGIFSYYGSVHISNSTLFNNFAYAIVCFGDSIIITNNTIHSNYGGILTSFGSAPLVYNNTITSNEWGIICNFGGYATIMGNAISNNSAGGIIVELGHLEIHHNTLASNGGFGIRSDHASINATNNTIFDNKRWGIYSIGAPIINMDNYFERDGKYNGEGDVLLEWEVHIKIYDTNNESIDNVNISIVDKNDNIMWQGTTIGNIRTVSLREYEITNNGTELTHTPFTITTTKGIHQNITVFDISGAQASIFASETIRIIIDIEEDEIVSNSTPQWFYLVIGSIWLVVLVFAIVGLMVTFKKRKRQY